MALFDYARVQVQIRYILIRSSETEEDTLKVMPIQFSPAIPCALYAHPRSKRFEVF
jgi:hypothetical protein